MIGLLQNLNWKKALLVVLFSLISVYPLLSLGSSIFIKVDPAVFKSENCNIFYDRQGNVLRYIPNDKGERWEWIDIGQIPEHLINAFIACEDERFYQHKGFDLISIFRAIYHNLKEGKIVSGASTISQQLVRIVQPAKRSFKNKILEILKAIKIEQVLSKDKILEQYLNRVYLGNNIRGVSLISKIYFGKRLDQISIAECAILAALAQAPERYNIYRGPSKSLLLRKDWVLERMYKLGYITKEELKAEKERKIDLVRKEFPFLAPHLVDYLEGKNLSGEVHCTVDLTIQKKVEAILKSHRERLRYRGARQACAMVVDNQSMEVLALCGSFDYSAKNCGFNNGCLAKRSAGSTIKPFIYALALENGFNASSLLTDTLKSYATPEGDYLPYNFDRNEYGPILFRDALGNSLNICTVRLLEEIGQEKFYYLLKTIGILEKNSPPAEHYGLGLVIGNVETSLKQLVTCYAMLANGGIYQELIFSNQEEKSSPFRVFKPETAYIISEILSDPSARLITFGNSKYFNFPFKVAFKTGTSTKYRDCWIVGYTPKYTVGVWVGNFEGDATNFLTGAEGAAPIFYDIFNYLHRSDYPQWFEKPENVIVQKVCSYSGLLPGKHCQQLREEFFAPQSLPQTTCTFHPEEGNFHHLPTKFAEWVYSREDKGIKGNYVLSNNDDQLFTSKIEKGVAITYPHHGDRFVPYGGNETISIDLKVEVNIPTVKVCWFIDGTEYKKVGAPYKTVCQLGKGRHSIAVIADNGYGDELEIWVD